MVSGSDEGVSKQRKGQEKGLLWREKRLAVEKMVRCIVRKLHEHEFVGQATI